MCTNVTRKEGVQVGLEPGSSSQYSFVLAASYASTLDPTPVHWWSRRGPRWRRPATRGTLLRVLDSLEQKKKSRFEPCFKMQFGSRLTEKKKLRRARASEAHDGQECAGIRYIAARILDTQQVGHGF